MIIGTGIALVSTIGAAVAPDFNGYMAGKNWCDFV